MEGEPSSPSNKEYEGTIDDMLLQDQDQIVNAHQLYEDFVGIPVDLANKELVMKYVSSGMFKCVHKSASSNSNKETYSTLNSNLQITLVDLPLVG